MPTPSQTLQRLSLATMAATYLHVLIGAGRTDAGLSALLVTVLAVLTAGYAWYTQQERKPILIASGLAVGLLGAQMAAQGLAFRLNLPPALVTINLGVAMAFLATWIVVSVMARGESFAHSLPVRTVSHWLVPLVGTVSVLAVMLLGSYAKSVGAASACLDWPLCQGQVVPEFGDSMVLLGFIHRLAAVVGGVSVLTTFAISLKNQKHRPGLVGLSLLAIGLYLMQVLHGAMVVLELIPPSLTVVHLATATGLFATLVTLTVFSYYSPPIPAVAGGSVAAAIVSGVMISPLATLKAYVELMKPRIVVLLLITGYAAMWVAQAGAPGLELTFWTMLGLTLSCGGANAVNMWFDRDIDVIMKRTQKRPVPSGRLLPEQALAFGVGCGIVSTLLLAVTVNVPTALLSLGGYIFYTIIYTMLLKRNTAQNIVIGGAAGAVPPLVGWAAVTGDVSWASVIMFLIVFMWTPPHFWALALFRNEDYRRAGVPMLPVVAGEHETKKQSLWYSISLLPICHLLYWPIGAAGPVYAAIAALINVIFIYYTVKQYLAKPGDQKPSHQLFGFSLLYLALIFLAMVVDARPLSW